MRGKKSGSSGPNYLNRKSLFRNLW